MSIFYLQSFYSIMKSLNSIESLVKKAKENCYDFIALSDKENLYGIFDFFSLCKKYKIKPIIGLQIDLSLDDIINQKKKIIILVYAFNDIGLQNLIKISNYFQIHKKCTLSKLRDLQDGVFFVLPNVDFDSNYLFNSDLIRKILQKLKNVFSFFFLGFSLQSNILDFFADIFLSIAKELDIKIVPAHKTSYLEENEKEAFDLLLKLSKSKKDFSNDKKQFFFDKTQKRINEIRGLLFDDKEENNNHEKLLDLYLESLEELKLSNYREFQKIMNMSDILIEEHFEDFKQKHIFSFQFLTQEEIKKKYQIYFNNYKYSFLNLKEFINLIDYKNLFPCDLNLPCLPLPKSNSNYSSFEYLKEQVYIFLKKYQKYFSDDIYQKRLEKELKIIQETKYENYFLIVADIVREAKNQGILLGPGRGSSASSLVCFCLGITEIDPLYYNLFFERFLNIQRQKMPDIDLDFPDTKISLILKYILQRYKDNFVANIVTFNTLRLKYLQSFLENVIFPKEKKRFANLKSMFQYYSQSLKKLDGIPRFCGTHPSGIVLSNKNLLEYIPIQPNPLTNSPFIYQTQLGFKQLEKIGLLKIDLLSLKSLSLVEKILQKINEKIDISWSNLPLDDQLTYSTLQKGNTDYIFQLESFSAKKILQQIKPDKFEDLIAILALNRPGPINYVNNYRVNKIKKISFFVHPLVDPILKKTYGLILYQEQIMAIAVKFAGYFLGEAETLMKYMSQDKKSKDLIFQKLKDVFIKRSIQKGHLEEQAIKVYNYLLKFSNYSFNKSHSVSYALISYRMAFLKTHYIDFFLVMLNEYINNPLETYKLLKQLKLQHQVKILVPDISKSHLEYCLLHNQLLMPLKTILSVNNELVSFIIQERQKRNFCDFFDFKKRCHKFLNDKILKDLILSGSLDFFGLNRQTLHLNADLEYLEHEQYLSSSFRKVIKKEEYSSEYLKESISEIFGFALSELIL
ncbi:PHP domain-containing protein [Candidatus Phytoplasma pini]|uniref:DNA-directed DNA polymerase n=1 Tax=Candidatus Phytoplasma pini TaxID=267362 RepID=A0A559KJV8_9MOLU|nr:PHP domain-containing protein [Candidatus Phytoplasma pini]TVY12399.1 DNA polymerase III, alpha subunit [Candidatus Phytoplasma pini]